MTAKELEKSFSTAKKWKDEALALREILLICDLAEEFKWRKPCYTNGGNNIAIIQRMNDFLALMFFKGALLDDPKGLLKEQGPNSRSAKRLEFTSVNDVTSRKAAIKALIKSAIEAEAKGLKVEKGEGPDMPEELIAAFEGDPEFMEAFENLTPGRQRGYAIHFNEAKQSETRTRRIEKYRDKILAGKGLQDRE